MMYLMRVKMTPDERFEMHKGTKSKQSGKYVSL